MIKVEIMAKDGTKVVKLTRSKAVHERCLNCSGWNAREVTNCSATDCPLYPFRTGKGSRGRAQERNKAIVRYCQWCFNGKSAKECTVRLCPLYAYRTNHVDESVIIERIKSNFPKSAFIRARNSRTSLNAGESAGL